ncbi:MAG: glycosyltransferase family 2 protein [Promethearchaeota archaeon]
MVKNLLIITPAYQEEKNIKKVIDKIKKIKIPGINITHLIVDDGSTDNTAIIAKNAKVKIIRHFKNMGIGRALKTGLIYAIKNDYDYVIQIDADGQHNPSDIKQIIKPLIKKEADLVIGSRMIKNPGYKIPFVRLIGIKFFAKVISILTKQKIYDSTSGYRAMNKKLFSELVKNHPEKLWAIETLIWICKKGYKVKEIPIEMNERVVGKSHLNFWRVFFYPLKIIFAILRALKI